MKRIGSPLIMTVLALTISCSGVRTVLEVAPELEPCIGVGPRECLLVRYAGQADWQLFYDAIAGFEFEPGFHYTLYVRKQSVGEPIAADASSVRWTLLRILDKTPAGTP